MSDIDSFIRQQKAKLANEREVLNNPAVPRKQWAQPVKLSPRGLLDTDALIEEVQREKEAEEYQQKWQKMHPGQEPSPRGFMKGSRPDQEGLKIDPPVVSRRYAANIPNAATISPRSQNQGMDDYKRRWKQQHLEDQGHAPARNQNNNMARPGGPFGDDVGRENQNPIKPATPIDRDAYKRMWEERNGKRGYQGRPLREQTDEYKASALGTNESDAAKLSPVLDPSGARSFLVLQNLKRWEEIDIKPYSPVLQKIRERNNEYNQFLANKREQDQRRFADKKQGGGNGTYATIPGLRYSTSAQKREREEERNREYNEMIKNKGPRGRKINDAPPVAPKQGWGTPTYEEMLDKKRAQESHYRRANDIGFETDAYARETDQRIKELDREMASKMANVNRERQIQGILDDPTWLSPRNLYSERRLLDPRGHAVDVAAAPQKRTANQQDGQYFATLPLAANPEAEKARRQEEYKRELQKQMADTAYARKAEREQGLLVNNNGIVQGDVGRSTYRRDRNVEAYHSKILDDLKRLDDISPRSNAILGRRQPSADRRNAGGLNLGGNNNPAIPLQKQAARSGNTGLLDMGFDAVVEPPRLSSLDPPAGVQYQPSQETGRARY